MDAYWLSEGGFVLLIGGGLLVARRRVVRSEVEVRIKEQVNKSNSIR